MSVFAFEIPRSIDSSHVTIFYPPLCLSQYPSRFFLLTGEAEIVRGTGKESIVLVETIGNPLRNEHGVKQVFWV